VAADEPFRYRGFASPNYTQVPDDVMDVLMPELSGAELKVLLYIIRRTFGFKKQADAISLNQIMNGITTNNGRVLDRGTGLSESTVLSALKGLIQKDVIVAERRRSATKGDQPTIYSLHMAETEEALPENRGRGEVEIGDPPPLQSGTQETVEQQTEGQDRSKLRTVPIEDYAGARDVLLPIVEDIAREFRDAAPLGSTLTRVVRLRQASGLDDDAFIGRLYRARQITKERTGAIRSGEPGRRQQVAYWLQVVEDLAKKG
jgi:phage replication O-like protein O